MPSVATNYEVRWRLQSSSGAWKTKTVPVTTEAVLIEGLERGKAYEAEARALSAAGTPSDWAPVTFTVADPSRAPRAPTGLTVQAVADGVSLKWTADAEQPADAEYCIERATAVGGPYTEFTRVRAMQYTYPTTDGVERWFRVRAVNFGLVYSAYSGVVSSTGVQVSAIAGNATAALAAAADAQADADTSLALLSDIAADGKLTAAEKVETKREYNEVTAEQSGIDAQATTYAIVTEKTAYDNAMTALKTYLKDTVAVLNGSYIWTGITGTTNIVRATWDTNWNTLYTTRQALLNAIAAKAKALADAAQLTGNSANDYITNGTFEQGSEFWVLGAGWRMASNPTDAFQGVTALCADGAISPGTDSRVYCTKVFSLIPDDVYIITAMVKPLAPNGAFGIGLLCYDEAATTLTAALEDIRSAASWGLTTGVYKKISLRCTIPAGASVRAIATFSRTGHSSGYWLVDNVTITKMPTSLDDVADSTTFVRYPVIDATLNGGIWRNGTRINGSGQQIGGSYNFPPGGFASVGATWLTGSSVTYSAAAGTPATATISCGAMTLRAMGSDKAYNSSSASVTGTNGATVKFHLYYDDDTWAGGTRTLGVTTDFDVVLNSRSRLYIGSISITFPASGTGGGGGPRPPCVVLESELPCGRIAAQIDVDTWMHLGNPDDFSEHIGKVSYAQDAFTPCVSLRLANGVRLDCSTTAPIPTEVGLLDAPDTLGHRVPTKLLRWRWLQHLPAAWTAHWRWPWRYECSEVVAVTDIGRRWVRHITVQDECFWAGAHRGAYMLHHNIKFEP